MFIFKGGVQNDIFSKHYSFFFEEVPSLFLCLFSYIAKPLLICIECCLIWFKTAIIFDISFLYAYILTNLVFLHYMWCALNWKTNYNVTEKYPLFVQKQSNLSIFSTSGILRRIVITNRIIRAPDISITSLESNICLSVNATLF